MLEKTASSLAERIIKQHPDLPTDWTVMRRRTAAIGVFAVLAATTASPSSAAITAGGTDPSTITRVGGVTLDGNYEVVEIRDVILAQPVNGRMVEVTGTRTTLRSVEPAGVSSCTINVTDGPPTLNLSPTGGRSLSGYSYMNVSSGCNSVTWTHAIYSQNFRNGQLTWVRRSTLYSYTVSPGGSDDDLRSSGCNGINTITWMNDTNYTSGYVANRACYFA